VSRDVYSVGAMTFPCRVVRLARQQLLVSKFPLPFPSAQRSPLTKNSPPQLRQVCLGLQYCPSICHHHHQHYHSHILSSQPRTTNQTPIPRDSLLILLLLLLLLFHPDASCLHRFFIINREDATSGGGGQRRRTVASTSLHHTDEKLTSQSTLAIASHARDPEITELL